MFLSRDYTAPFSVPLDPAVVIGRFLLSGRQLNKHYDIEPDRSISIEVYVAFFTQMTWIKVYNLTLRNFPSRMVNKGRLISGFIGSPS